MLSKLTDDKKRRTTSQFLPQLKQLQMWEYYFAVSIDIKARLKNMLVCSHLTRSTRKMWVCPSYAYPAEQSKSLDLPSTSFFNCLYCFDLSHPLSYAQVSLDCATLDRQITQWKTSAAAIRNTNDLENVQMWIKF